MDNRYLMRAARYVELNPVRAKLCRVPWRCPWSSAAAHIARTDDALVRVRPLLERTGDWREFLSEGLEVNDAELFRCHERTGRGVFWWEPMQRGRGCFDNDGNALPIIRAFEKYARPAVRTDGQNRIQ